MTRRNYFAARIVLTGLAAVLLGFSASLTAQDENPDSSGAERSQVLYVDLPVPIPAPEVAAVPPDPGLPVASAYETEGSLEESAELQEYLERVARIEAGGGAWDPDLEQQLAALALFHQEQGNHTAAIENFQRALHINRINSGLFNLEQVPVVERLIDSYTALGSWPEVDLYQQYLYYVQERAYGMQDPRMIPALERLGNWHIEAFTLGFGETLGLRLGTAQLLFAGAVQMVESHFGKHDERYINNQRNVARSAYLVHRYPEYVIAIDRPEFRSAQNDLNDKLNNPGHAVPGSFRTGSDALTAIVEYYEAQADQPRALAAALVDLADWHVIFDRRQTAREFYRRAWDVLAGLPDSEELLSQFFGQVITLPAFAVMPTNLVLGTPEGQQRNGMNHDYVDVSLTVTEYGDPRDIEILDEETDANRRQFGQLRREIRETRFRPLIRDGEPQSSTGHLFRYRYWY